MDQGMENADLDLVLKSGAQLSLVCLAEVLPIEV